MKIFDRTEPFTNKVNFVDENGTLVGYDLDQKCCENAGWFIAKKICDEIKTDISDTMDLRDYRFDNFFFQEIKLLKDGEEDDCSCVVFSLYNSDNLELYLHLFNSHNGYYSHGFHFLIDEEAKQTGSI